ncbi:hypothetical protein Hamer_G011238 [Homarus americanus]|uniref:Uncharacterized protein n=1 Tax=Homarus americanus TaxID=6706 RepID=A0A8J5JID8_HOMAM|nr:hypothetical protein Hamer_G011238 [Homarus americanus]
MNCSVSGGDGGGGADRTLLIPLIFASAGFPCHCIGDRYQSCAKLGRPRPLLNALLPHLNE